MVSVRSVSFRLSPRPRVRTMWVVVNPVKVADLRAFQSEVVRAASRFGCFEVRWLMTSVEETGASQARDAVAAGARVVVAAGGDGTVRSVAGGLSEAAREASRSVLFGIIPVGTGNVLSRNLGIPRRRAADAVELILGASGRVVPLDLAWLRTDDSPNEYPFLSLAGAGFDGATMVATSSKWKSRIGWPAYIGGAWRSRRIPAVSTRIRLFSSSGVELSSFKTQAKSIVVSNIGRLPLMHLAPAADYADGLVDVAMVNTRAGLLGWTALGFRLAGQYVRPWKTRRLREAATAGAGVSLVGVDVAPPAAGGMPRYVSSLEYAQASRVRVELSEARMVEVDGDALHESSAFEVRIDRHALQVRVPR